MFQYTRGHFSLVALCLGLYCSSIYCLFCLILEELLLISLPFIKSPIRPTCQ